MCVSLSKLCHSCSRNGGLRKSETNSHKQKYALKRLNPSIDNQSHSEIPSYSFLLQPPDKSFHFPLPFSLSLEISVPYNGDSRGYWSFRLNQYHHCGCVPSCFCDSADSTDQRQSLFSEMVHQWRTK